MRALVVLMLALLLAGCSSGNDAADDDGGDVPEAPAQPTPPADQVYEGSLMGIGDPVGLPVAPPPCVLGALQCATHTVQVPAGDWNVTFTLVGTSGTVTSAGVPFGTDYDLVVDGVGSSNAASGEDDVVVGHLAGGNVAAQVLAWHDIDGSYKLTVSFAPYAA